ncbi:hypothetical protein, variant 1 [Aphanomyces astaci]|uniref:THO complex subunit 2 n=1 Tax=Aphanomyces astaci TaxID=112090 RepID=W4FQT3_APHAT|nr:hypothetical protein, variant 1 [Aphanomyces astaci]ETV69311.1 hypothetical protein, variant 1 [Aphanomyces astaci]|eukprot:XP_009841168.1 hypothetical protein, variant 1 [Aphanomyces astaci]
MELVRNWAGRGGAKHAVEKIRQAQSSSDRDELTVVLNALLWGVARGVVPQQEVLDALVEAGLGNDEAATATLADVLWVISNQAERMRDQGNGKEWVNMCALVGEIHSRALVPPATLKSVLELEILHEAGISSEPTATIMKKVVRINTRNLYTQNKFNLLKEESEGFAKVLCLLHSDITCETLQASKQNLLSLIGYFDLDPNRVLDLVLDAYEVHYTNECFMELLTEFKVDGIAHVLGFKFQFYARQSIPAPRSLFRLAATLIQHDLLTLAVVYPHLSPTKDAVVAAATQDRLDVVQHAKSYGKVNLNAKKPDDEHATAAAADTSQDKHATNQLYGLIVGLLEVGATGPGFALIEWFTAQNVDPLQYKPLALQVCQFVHDLIDDMYAPLSLRSLRFASSAVHPSPDIPRRRRVVPSVQTVDAFVAQVVPKLHLIGAHLHHDQFLWTKLLRMLSPRVVPPLDRLPPDTVESLIRMCFLPALSVHTCCPHLVYQTWDLVKAYSVDTRYKFYLHWQTQYSTVPFLQLKQAETIQLTRKIMRRLTADKTKPTGRLLTHVAHANPLVAFTTMLQQLQSYENLIQPVVECLKYMSPLGMDVLSFVLISELSRPRKTFKADGHNVSLWLSSLAQFAGSFYRKYPTVELGALLSFLFRRLSAWESGELIVLSELLTKMGSCLALEDISTTQLEALAGGPTLGFESPDPKLNNKRAIPCLRNTLVKQNLAWPLCLVIGQMRSQIEFNTSAQHLKLVGASYDTAQRTLNQLLAFLSACADPATYVAALPSVTELVRDFHVPDELAMVLVRPAMRAHDPLLRKVTRSVHAGGSGNLSPDDPPGRWFMYDPNLLADVGRAFDGSPFVGMTKDLFTTFWGLTLYDIYVPHAQYNAEIQKAKNDLKLVAANPNDGDRKKPKDRLMGVIDTLVNEMKDQVAHRKAVFARFESVKHRLCTPNQSDTVVVQLLQKCVLPRSLLSPEDALYCAKFMQYLHSISVPHLSTLQYYQKVTLNLSGLVLCTTEREASNFGIFLRETFSVLGRWFESADEFNDQGVRSGFSVSLTDPTNILDYDKYRNLYRKWHNHLEKVYAHTLTTGEYMPTRNSLVLLTKLIDVFPTTRPTTDKLFGLVDALTKDDRSDVKLMATSYAAMLKRKMHVSFPDTTKSQDADDVADRGGSKRSERRDSPRENKGSDVDHPRRRGRSREKKPDAEPLVVGDKGGSSSRRDKLPSSRGRSRERRASQVAGAADARGLQPQPTDKRGRSSDRASAVSQAAEHAPRGRSRDKKPTDGSSKPPLTSAGDKLPSSRGRSREKKATQLDQSHPSSTSSSTTTPADKERPREKKDSPRSSTTTPLDKERSREKKDSPRSSTTTPVDKERSREKKDSPRSSTTTPADKERSRDKKESTSSSSTTTPVDKERSRDKKESPRSSTSTPADKERSRDKKPPQADGSQQSSTSTTSAPAVEKAARGRSRDKKPSQPSIEPSSTPSMEKASERSRDKPTSSSTQPTTLSASNTRTIPSLSTEASLKQQVLERGLKKRERDEAAAEPPASSLTDQPPAKARKLVSTSLVDVNVKRVQDDKKRRLEQRKSESASTKDDATASRSGENAQKVPRSGPDHPKATLASSAEPSSSSSRHRQGNNNNSRGDRNIRRDRRDGGGGGGRDGRRN